MATATVPDTENEPTTAPPSIGPTDLVPFDPPLAPITVPMYLKILNAGILAEERVYLWNGRLAVQMTIGRPHTIAVQNTHYAFLGLNLPAISIEQEQPMAFRLSHSAPGPDIKLLRGHSRNYPVELPTSADVPLVVEVADSTLRSDRRKMAAYALEGIPVAWIVNLVDRTVEVYQLERPDAFGLPTVHDEGTEVPVVLDGEVVARLQVRDLLP